MEFIVKKIGSLPGETAVTSAQMKEIERKADEAGLSYYQMMENAGKGAAELIDSKIPTAGKKVLVFCGKGNNGGDGFVAARILTELGASVTLILVEGEPKTEDSQQNQKLCEAMEIKMIRVPFREAAAQEGADDEMAASFAEIRQIMGQADLVIDAVYGTGFHGVLREPVRTILMIINQSQAPVYSLDIPSGLNGDTGEADDDTVRAEGTVVFHQWKPAHLEEKNRTYCGELSCISIGIEAVLPDSNQ